jgi:hypothetical protein
VSALSTNKEELEEIALRHLETCSLRSQICPLQPNYIALIGGSPDGCTSDSNINLGTSYKSVVDLLEAKGISWKSYQEDYPGNCVTGATYGRYAR